jgi:hypothetical protein
MSQHDAADTMHVLGQHAMQPMRESITQLREQGHDALADELTRLRDLWAKVVVRHVTALSMGCVPTLKPVVKAPRPRLKLVTRELPPPPQRAGSRARDLPGDAS